MEKISPAIVLLCAIVFLHESASAPPPSGSAFVSDFLDQICSELGIKWSSPWHKNDEHEDGALFVRDGEFRLLSIVLEGLYQTDRQEVVNATRRQIIHRRSGRNSGQSDIGFDFPMLFDIFRLVLQQHPNIKGSNSSKFPSEILSQWLVDALELMRPVNELLSSPQYSNQVNSDNRNFINGGIFGGFGGNFGEFGGIL